MIRGFRIGWILLVSTAIGCSSSGGLSLFPSGDYLTTPAREVLENSPRAADLPRELSRSVLPTHFLQPGDMVVIEPVQFESEVRLPADQRVMADGTVDLGGFGRVVVSGLTLEDAKRLIETRIVDAGGEPTQISIRLIEPQQVYYVLGEVSAPGAYPLVGSETVLDAILTAGGLTDRASPCDLILVRPTAPPSCRVTLPICYQAITQLGDTTTNYQLQPGDRVFVATRTLCEELMFWRARRGCPRCDGRQCPCPSPEAAAYQNPISDFLPIGPEPVEFHGQRREDAASDDEAPAPAELLQPPGSRSPAAADDPFKPARPADGIAPDRPADPSMPLRPDPFDSDEFFQQPD